MNKKKISLTDIRIRDPFFLKQKDEYYLYGTTDRNTWDGPGVGFDYYKSKDLEWFEGPFPAFRPGKGFWANQNFWAPEVWEYESAFYMIASFKTEGRCRGVQILRSSSPEGPFEPITDGPVTPPEWECLDGTLVLNQGKIYLVFCHEWLQVGDGEICAMELTNDLKGSKGIPRVLFRGSEAKWTIEHEDFGHRGYVTDGPFVFKDKDGTLHMLWSSFGQNGYAIGMSHGEGSLMEHWRHDKVPIVDRDGGHGMIFEGLQGEKLLAIHAPNELLKERVRLQKLSFNCN